MGLRLAFASHGVPRRRLRRGPRQPLCAPRGHSHPGLRRADVWRDRAADVCRTAGRAGNVGAVATRRGCHKRRGGDGIRRAHLHRGLRGPRLVRVVRGAGHRRHPDLRDFPHPCCALASTITRGPVPRSGVTRWCWCWASWSAPGPSPGWSIMPRSRWKRPRPAPPISAPAWCVRTATAPAIRRRRSRWWSSATCNVPSCAAAEPEMRDLRQRYRDRVRFVFRQFPLEKMHIFAMTAAEASECAAQQGKFWEAVDRLYAANGELGDESLERYARELGLDTAKFKACLNSGETRAVIQRDCEDGKRARGPRHADIFPRQPAHRRRAREGEVWADAGHRAGLRSGEVAPPVASASSPRRVRQAWNAGSDRPRRRRFGFGVESVPQRRRQLHRLHRRCAQGTGTGR